MPLNLAFVRRPACELCGSGDFAILLSKPFTDSGVTQYLEEYYGGRIPHSLFEGVPFEIAECKRCRFLWQSWILNGEGMKALYSEWIDAGSSLSRKTSGGVDITFGYAREAASIAKFFAKPASFIRVLDYGMGWGGWAAMALAFGYSVSGIELSEERRAHARERGITVVDFEALPQNSFDFINAEQVFEHIPDPREVLLGLARSLAPGGVVRIAVPNAERGLSALQGKEWKASKGPFQPLEHINGFTHATLVALGKAAGLRPVMRPVFPLLGSTIADTIQQLLAPLYTRFKGTTAYFQKIAP